MRALSPDLVAAIRTAPADESARSVARKLGVSANAVRRYRGGASPMRADAGGPFGAGPQGTPRTPDPSWGADQPVPAPQDVAFRRGYHDHTYRSFSAPLAFEGWTLDRIRAAVAAHDQGIFVETSALAITSTRFAPVFAALQQAIAPVISLPRYVRGGLRGFARVVREEVEEQLAPRDGLMPSQFFPPTLWGSVAIDVRMMGFAVLQHVYGDPDPVTGVRPIYTRRWPTWAVQYYRVRRQFVAITSDGPVDIVNGDGKFTLVADSEEPHFDGAIRALATEVLDGALVKQARASYIDRYGQPKLWGTMPANVGVRSPEGDAFFDALEMVRGPDGFGVGPHGSTLTWASLDAKASGVFTDALDNVWQYVAAILLGSDGTMSKGSGGVYTSPIFAGVRRDLVDRLLKAIVRGVNLGHVAPYLAINYASTIASTRGWVEPVLDIPLPDPDADARRKAYAERAMDRTAIITAEKGAGLDVTQERVDQLSSELGLQGIALGASAPPEPVAPEPEALPAEDVGPEAEGVGAAIDVAPEDVADDYADAA